MEQYITAEGKADLEAAGKRAEEIAGNCTKEDMANAFDEFRQSLGQLSQEDLDKMQIPAQTGSLMRANTDEQQGWFDMLVDHVRETLCKEGGDFHKYVDEGLKAAGGTVVGAILGAMGWSLGAIGVAIAIAGVVLCAGLDVFCHLTEPKEAFA